MTDLRLDVSPCPHCGAEYHSAVLLKPLGSLWLDKTHWGCCPVTGMALFFNLETNRAAWERLIQSAGAIP